MSAPRAGRGHRRPTFHRALLAVAALALAPCVFAEAGYDLWLRYVPVQAQWLAPSRSGTPQLVLSTQGAGPLSPTLPAALDAIDRGLTGMLGDASPASDSVTDARAHLLS